MRKSLFVFVTALMMARLMASARWSSTTALPIANVGRAALPVASWSRKGIA